MGLAIFFWAPTPLPCHLLLTSWARGPQAPPSGVKRLWASPRAAQGSLGSGYMPAPRRSRPPGRAAQPLPATPLPHGVRCPLCALSPGGCCHPRPGWHAGCSGSQWGSHFTAPCHTLADRCSSSAEPQSGPLPLGAPLGLPARAWQTKSRLRFWDRRPPAARVHLPPLLCQPPPPRCLLTSISLSVSVCPSSCVFRRGCSKFNSQ